VLGVDQTVDPGVVVVGHVHPLSAAVMALEPLALELIMIAVLTGIVVVLAARPL
jgi:hypothetical protein